MLKARSEGSECRLKGAQSENLLTSPIYIYRKRERDRVIRAISGRENLLRSLVYIWLSGPSWLLGLLWLLERGERERERERERET